MQKQLWCRGQGAFLPPGLLALPKQDRTPSLPAPLAPGKAAGKAAA